MSKLIAVVPQNILQRWDQIAVMQLCRQAERLAEENDELRQQLHWAEDAAEFWRENATELAGDSAGLTIDGKLVRLS